MTTARSLKEIDPGDIIICEAVAEEIDKQRRRARREHEPAINQGRVAAEVFGKPQQWISRRLTGEIPFTSFELKRVGDFLGVDIFDWYAMAKNGGSDPGTGQATVPCATSYLTVLSGGGDTTPRTVTLTAA